MAFHYGHFLRIESYQAEEGGGEVGRSMIATNDISLVSLVKSTAYLAFIKRRLGQMTFSIPLILPPPLSSTLIDQIKSLRLNSHAMKGNPISSETSFAKKNNFPF